VRVLGQTFRNNQANFCTTICYAFIPTKKKNIKTSNDRERQGIKRRRTRNPPKTELHCNKGKSKGKTHIYRKEIKNKCYKNMNYGTSV